MPLLGHIALWLTLLTAVWAVGTGIGAATTRRPELAASAARAATAIAVALIVAVAALATAVLRQDYHVAYVAAWSDRALSTGYRWAVLYAGPEGRLLCWTAAVAVCGAVTTRRDRPTATAVLAAVVVVAVLVLLVGENPFAQLAYTPVDGRGLAAELLDPAMLLYPPALFAGFAAAMVPFARALAAVPTSGRHIDIRRPTLVAWTLLTAAIALGLWWSYRRVGWGETWTLDPVRSQSLPAWLMLAALVRASRAPSAARWAALQLGLALLAGVLAVWGMFTPSAEPVPTAAALLAVGALAVVLVAVRAPEPGRWSVRTALTGLALAAIALAAQPFAARTTARLAPGQSVTLTAWGGRRITVGYIATSRYPVANRIVVRALLEVRRGDRPLGRIGPDQRQFFDIFGNDRFEPVRRTAALHGVAEDVFASLESVSGPNDTVELRVAVNPLVLWLWLGCALLVAAGVLAIVADGQGGPRA
jgi:cytochrome c-type biogenesis protein CcmF